MTAARVLLARGQPTDLAQATVLLTAFRARAEREHATNWTIQARAVQALVARAQGDGAAALDHLATAADLAAPGGFVHTFLDMGSPLAALLRGVAARRPPSPYLARLLAAFADASIRTPAVVGHLVAAPSLLLLGQLTEREVQILELLARHMTNKEIAAELSISPMTVKRHVGNVYDKLGVGTRRQAIVQSIALNLLSPAPR